jgi:hypothetical protein
MYEESERRRRPAAHGRRLAGWGWVLRLEAASRSPPPLDLTLKLNLGPELNLAARRPGRAFGRDGTCAPRLPPYNVPVPYVSHVGSWQPPAKRVARAGVTLNWTQPELEVIDRYVRAMAAGSFRSAGEAAPDCQRELDDLRRLNPALPRRSLVSIRRLMGTQCKALGLGYALSFWTADELRMVKRHARQFLAGGFPTIRDAGRACLRKLTDELGSRRTLEGTCWHMARAIRAMGVPAREQEWTKSELKVLDRHVRMLHCGRHWTVTDMAEECSRALGGRRSPEAIRGRVKPMLSRIGLPRFHGFGEPFERELIERYARSVTTDDLGAWHAAGEACHKELEAAYAQRALTATGGASPDYGRTAVRTCRELLRVAASLGLHIPRDQRRWSEAENRICESWGRWLRGHRANRRNAPLTQAAEGLIDDLADKGFRRSLAACRQRLGEYNEHWRLAHGRQQLRRSDRQTATRAR